jgi:hypothetical protein
VGDIAGAVAGIVPKARLRHDDMGSVMTSVIARLISMHPALLANAINQVVKTQGTIGAVIPTARQRSRKRR